jgi:hypothetical protein
MKKLLVLLAFATAAGCGHFPGRHEATGNEQTAAKDPAPLREQVRKARRFVVVQGSWALWNSDSTRWVFDADGRCFGETTKYYNGHPTGDKITVELPRETFRVAQQAVLESKLLSLPPGQQNVIFEGGLSLAVECGGREHAITFSDAPDGCRQLLDFLRSLPDRGKAPEQRN